MQQIAVLGNCVVAFIFTMGQDFSGLLRCSSVLDKVATIISGRICLVIYDNILLRPDTYVLPNLD